MLKAAVVLAALLVLWAGLDLSGLGIALGSAPAGSAATEVPSCRFLTARGVVERPAFGLDPNCPSVLRD